jgi:DNA (cytosine-5)-methyltransferase 1
MRYGSVCSGIEAATMAWHGLGWEPAFFSDIEKFPVAVLQHHYPDVPCHGDFTDITEDEYGAIDLLVGGTPCQSFSIAGLRGGMDDERGNLALEFIRLAQRKRPQWLVWENVPGVLSSNGGRDFGSFLGALAEIGYGFAYRVLDAQYFGVAQRRRRVFVVGYLGDWRRAAAVLFERESLSGNPPPSREAKQEATGATEDGSGERGSPIAFTRCDDGRDATTDLAPTMRCGSNHSAHLAIACSEVAPAVTTGPPFSRTGNERVECEDIVPMQVFDKQRIGQYGDGEVSSTLAARDYKGATDLVAFQSTANADEAAAAGINVSPTLRVSDPMAVAIQAQALKAKQPEGQGFGVDDSGVSYTLTAGDRHAVASNLSVRRLTPTECERLQGFPDSYTQIPWRGKEPENCPDGPRYKALGNSMAVPVMRWIGERIQAVEAI